MSNQEHTNSERRHMIIMILACVVPVAMIFGLSFFGISGAWVNAGAIALMVFLHIFMMKDHFLCNKKNKGGAS